MDEPNGCQEASGVSSAAAEMIKNSVEKQTMGHDLPPILTESRSSKTLQRILPLTSTIGHIAHMFLICYICSLICRTRKRVANLSGTKRFDQCWLPHPYFTFSFAPCMLHYAECLEPEPFPLVGRRHQALHDQQREERQRSVQQELQTYLVARGH